MIALLLCCFTGTVQNVNGSIPPKTQVLPHHVAARTFQMVQYYYHVPANHLEWYYTFYNTDTYESYYFSSDGSNTDGELGEVPAGHYIISCSSYYHSTPFEFYTDCGDLEWNFGYYDYETDVNDGCNTIIIDPA